MAPDRFEQAVLLLVDIQRDFLPGGALAVRDGAAILPGVATLMEHGPFALQVATQDWHPAGHVSFATSHAGRQPFETIDLYGREQVLWPDHCVQATPGAALHPDFPWHHVQAVIRKGEDPAVDSYSGFRNNWNVDGQRRPTGLGGYLRERGITDVFICGLARDVCVEWTAEDAVALGFSACVIWNLTRPVDASSNERVATDLTQRGVRIIDLGRGTTVVRSRAELAEDIMRQLPGSSSAIR